MKTKRIAIACLISLACAFSPSASAAVIVNDAVLGPSPYGPGHVFLTLSQSIPSGQGLFAIDIATVSSSQYLFSYAGIAEYYKLFSVSLGTRFDPAFVLQNNPIVANDNNPGSNTQFFLSMRASISRIGMTASTVMRPISTIITAGFCLQTPPPAWSRRPAQLQSVAESSSALPLKSRNQRRPC